MAALTMPLVVLLTVSSFCWVVLSYGGADLQSTTAGCGFVRGRLVSLFIVFCG